MFRVPIYKGTCNLGDAIQTIALCRLLATQCLGVVRDQQISPAHAETTFVVNGWLGESKASINASNCVFAGVHVGSQHEIYLSWMRESGVVVGARDPFTRGLLTNYRIPSKLVGCATLTFERYRGRRTGKYSVDVPSLPGTMPLSNTIDRKMTWPEQWAAASQRLSQLRKAEIVYSSRLHIILPCLAFGTPVVFPLTSLKHVNTRERLSILDGLGFAFDEVVEADVTGAAETYCKFLSTQLNGYRLGGGECMPPMPHPLNE